MVAACELIALCLGVIGLVGTSATTGLPMWKVTAFIQENIIVMETRWEGLWMNCFRQANIRMQCKVYDSLLYLPAELQAARGLMCSAVALSFLGLITSFPGLDSTACLQGQPRIKSLLLAIAGAMLVMAALCVIIPVSWTAHVIIQDFYNPLLLDAQRRELGEALYIGWVTGAILFVSGVLFLSCRSSSKYSLSQLYQPVYTTNSSNLSQTYPFRPVPSSINSLPQQPLLQGHNLTHQQSLSSTYSPVAVNTASQPVLYNPQLAAPSVPVVYNAHQHQQLSAQDLERLSNHRSSAHISLMSASRPLAQPTTQLPVVYGYGYSRNGSDNTVSSANSGVYI
ncbi:claudin-8-like [Astyanax mexicanus]|uniref:Claudin-8-like n=1 Tax=Astyanax mexicanus TaxID=7994 RepID=A0A8T2L7C1_ASTMX|nr:claudin-8-like [Astyanax mexicanus]